MCFPFQTVDAFWAKSLRISQYLHVSAWNMVNIIRGGYKKPRVGEVITGLGGGLKALMLPVVSEASHKVSNCNI